MIRLIGFILIALALSTAVACGGGGGGEDATPTPGAPVDAGPTSTVGPSPTTAPTFTPVVETDGAAGFRAFAPRIDLLFAGRNVAAVLDRMLTESIVCTEEDVANAGPGEPACTAEGQAFEGFPVGAWRSEGAILPITDAVIDLSRAFATFQPQATDDFGDGNVRLYALNVEPDEYDAIITTIISRPENIDGEGPLRIAFGTSWEFVEGRWMMTGLLVAMVLGEELLEPADEVVSGLYPGWERFEAP